MADPYASFSTPTKAGDPYASFATPTATSTEGGVQDYEPMPRSGRSFGERAIDWGMTRLLKAGTGFAGQARAFSDLNRAVGERFGLSPEAASVLVASNPVAFVGQFMPSTEQMNKAIFQGTKAQETNLPGGLGKAVDVGVETVLQAPAMPGSVARNVAPAFVGGTAQELAGQAVEGTPYELPVRVVTGALAGGGTALAQNYAGNAAQGIKNVLPGGNVDNRVGRILGRALENDKSNANALIAAHADLAPGTPLVVAGGENVRGAVRGSTAAPGPARTTVAEGAENYLIGADKRVGAAIGQNVSNAPPISTRINTLETGQTAASRPAYEAAGVPRRPEMLRPERTVKFAIDEPPVTLPAEWNAPNFTSPRLEQLARDSGPIKSAIASARSLSEYKHVPANSMIMWDEAYKQLGGMEREAIRAGNDRWAMKVRDERINLGNAISEVNPRYGRALAAYSEPQKLIDAAETGRNWFSKNAPPDQVAREFKAMPADQQKEALGGVADFLRTKAANSDRATAAERIWNNQNVRDRLKAILPDEQYQTFAKSMDQDKSGAKAIRSITQGSRTTPMMLEAADNATGSALTNALRGRFLSAALEGGNALLGRIGEGRTQAVNARLAEMMMETDPAKVGLVRSLAERARLEEAARRYGRSNALTTGAALPAIAGTR